MDLSPKTGNPNLGPTPNPGKGTKAEVMYGANVAQLFLGILITGANSLLLASILTRPRHKTSTNMLLGNICFVNVVVGVMLSVVNVGDGWYEVSLLKTESALVILDSFVNVATLLALITNNFVAIKNPEIYMTAKNCAKIIFGIWAAVLFLCFAKAMVFAFDRLDFPTACYRCFVVFEVVTSLIFSLVTVLVFAVTVYMVTRRKKRAVSDQARPVPAERNREYAVLVTAGFLLVVYFLCFLMFVFMYISWLAHQSTVSPGLAEVIVSLFFLHALMNPLIIIARHKDLRNTVKSILCCGYMTENTEAPEVGPPPDQIFVQRPQNISIARAPTPYNHAGPDPTSPDLLPYTYTPYPSGPVSNKSNEPFNTTQPSPKSPVRLPPMVEPRTTSNGQERKEYETDLEAGQTAPSAPEAIESTKAIQSNPQRIIGWGVSHADVEPVDEQATNPTTTV